MKIVVSRDKSKVLRWARKNNRSVLWQRNGVWHAAISSRHTPTDADAIEVHDEIISVELPYPKHSHIGQELARLRESCGMTQAELAKRISIHKDRPHDSSGLAVTGQSGQSSIKSSGEVTPPLTK